MLIETMERKSTDFYRAMKKFGLQIMTDPVEDQEALADVLLSIEREAFMLRSQLLEVIDELQDAGDEQ